MSNKLGYYSHSKWMSGLGTISLIDDSGKGQLMLFNSSVGWSLTFRSG